MTATIDCQSKACGRPAIFRCRECGKTLCGVHEARSQTWLDPWRLVPAIGPPTGNCISCQGIIDKRLSEEAAQSVAIGFAQQDSQEQRDRALAQVALEESRKRHAEAVALNRERHGPEEPIHRRIVRLEGRVHDLTPRVQRWKPGIAGLLVLAFCGYLAALALGGLVGEVILKMSDDTANRVAPILFSIGAGLGALVWALLVLRANFVRSSMATTRAAIVTERAKLGCGKSKCGTCAPDETLTGRSLSDLGTW